MDDLIDMVKIDGFHSFQDVILPVGDAKARFGDRVPLMGGVDMHKLATLPEDELRNYLRAILDRCMPGGRFAFGSGNTIANYIPLKNYAILLEEARRWRP
jgi:uroporphyrinogen decarboxylase